MTRTELKELERLEKNANPMPWLSENICARIIINDRDAEFIVAARNAIPKLLEERNIMVEALKYIRWEGFDRDFWDRINKAKKALEEVGEL